MSSLALKLFALFCMTLDHIYTYLPGMPIWFGYIGRLAAPIFFFLIVEGFFHTGSRRNYLLRLTGFSVLMVAVDFLLEIPNNIFLSLALAVALMMCFEYMKSSRHYLLPSLIGLLAGAAMLFTEASMWGLLMTLIFYFLREKKIWKTVVYVVLFLPIVDTLSGWSSVSQQLFLFDYQWMMVFAAPFFWLYNGKPGYRSKLTKWLFYGYYPAHLILLVLLGRALGA